ncbi:MAG: PAS domain-containing protein [Candidatus Schekmanbacteria bacterium]|nr:PAS domain-containing protein [Candidatus Schekmanbacteria bacterium]
MGVDSRSKPVATLRLFWIALLAAFLILVAGSVAADDRVMAGFLPYALGAGGVLLVAGGAVWGASRLARAQSVRGVDDGGRAQNFLVAYSGAIGEVNRQVATGAPPECDGSPHLDGRSTAARAVAERELIDKALRTAGLGLLIVDPTGTAHVINERWHELLGSSPAAAHLDEVTSARQRAWSLALDTFRTRCSSTLEVDLPSRSGPEHRAVQLTAAPICDETGAATHVAILAMDVSSQRRTRDQMIRAGRLAAVGELAGNVAHEVNNPIAVISAKGRLLLTDHRTEMSEKVAEDVQKIVALADRVAQIARGLLSFSRPAHQIPEPIELQAPVGHAVLLIRQQAESLGITVALDVDRSLPPVRANAADIEQILLNLLLNAIDAMPDGGTLSVSSSGGAETLANGRPAVAIRVSDTGHGIPTELQRRVFEPFFTTKEQAGTGLGLSICLALVRGLGGEIDLESQDGQGTTFIIRFPVEIKQ